MKIPWTDAVVVKEFKEWRRATLAAAGAEATIEQNGTFDVRFDSRALIPKWMVLEPERTKELRAFLRSLGFKGPFERLVEVVQAVETWVTPHPSFSPRRRLEWPPGRLGWSLGILGSESSRRARTPFFLGDDFWYVHFTTHEGREGAAVLWREAEGVHSEPEVWIGDFEGFLYSQEAEDLDDPNSFIRFNAFFQNGFMWALDRLGGFYVPGYITRGAAEAIGLDPWSLLPESIDKILRGWSPHPLPPDLAEMRLSRYPAPIQSAVRLRLAEEAR